MCYDAKDLEKRSINAIKKHKLTFIQDVVAHLPCSKQTFYTHELDKLDSIKDELTLNRTKKKLALRTKWEQSDNPTLEIAVYKLYGTDEEAERLNGSKQKIEHSGDLAVEHSGEVAFKALADKIYGGAGNDN